MSEADANALRDAYAAFNRGDYDEVASLFHHDAVWHAYLAAVDGKVFRGREAIVAMWKQLEEGFGATLRMEVVEMIDCGDSVVAVVEGHATGSQSGATVGQRWVQVASFRDGLIAEVRPYPDREAALAAARG